MVRYLFTILISLWATIAVAQEPVFRNYGVEEGLPSSETYSIAQDSRGYIFIGTDRGLVRFDGVNFETFTTKDGLVDNNVFQLSPHPSRIWYNTLSGSIGYIAGDELHSSPRNELMQEYFKNAVSTAISVGDDGELLVGKIDRGYYRIHAINPLGQMYAPFPDPEAYTFRDIYITSDGLCLSQGSVAANTIRVHAKDKKLLCQLRVQASEDRSLFAYHRQGKIIMCIRRSLFSISGGKATWLRDVDKDALFVFVDDVLNIWVGYRHTGLSMYSPADNYRQPVSMLSPYSVSSIMQDREKGLWFTTLENGVYYLPPDHLFAIGQAGSLPPFKTLKVLNHNGRPHILQSNLVLHARQNDGSWKPVFPGRLVFSALSPGDGKLYFTGQIHWQVPGDSSAYIKLVAGRVLHVGKRVVTAANGNIKSFDLLGNDARESNYPAIKRFTAIYELRDNEYIAGTARGMYILRNDSLLTIARDSLDKIVKVSGIEAIDGSHIAVATHGNGILVVDKNSYKIVSRITNADGLKGSAVNAVYRQNDTVLWVGTNKGLGRIRYAAHKAKMTIDWADMNDGILSNEINDICSIGTRLWLTTNKGITLFPLSKKFVYDDSIPIYIQSVTVNGKPWAKKYTGLNHNQNNLSISFIGLSYHFATALKYCYRLKGKENAAWEFTNTPTVNYSALPPGNYVFEYGALTPNQKQVGNYASFSFSILPPFWLRWWFICSVALVFIALLYWFVQARFRAVRGQMQLVTDLNAYRDRALRSQMSPHFIYNSLTLVQSHVVKNDADTSISIIAKFSKLMRLIFKNTGEELVTIAHDLEALGLYVEMEQMRFPEKFRFDVYCETAGGLLQAHIPPLLLQPFVENAILHGLLAKKQGGVLSVSIAREADVLHVAIQDNGIGRVAAAEIRKNKMQYMANEQVQRKDSGISISIARIRQVWGKTPEKSGFKIVDLYTPEGFASGTLVEFDLPFIP